MRNANKLAAISKILVGTALLLGAVNCPACGGGRTRRGRRPQGRDHSRGGWPRGRSPVEGGHGPDQQGAEHEDRDFRRLGLQRDHRGASQQQGRRGVDGRVRLRAGDHPGAGRGFRSHGHRRRAIRPTTTRSSSRERTKPISLRWIRSRATRLRSSIRVRPRAP